MLHSCVVDTVLLNTKDMDYIVVNPQVQFTISQLAVSGLKVNRLDMYGEKYKPFKGVKYITKAGRFQIRM